MNDTARLSDFDHPDVKNKALFLTGDKSTQLEKTSAIFHFVRDGIFFGFPPTWDALKASETLNNKVGYCTPKAALFHALCQAADIPSQLHISLIKIDVMRGILPAFAFHFLPDTGCHVWVEINREGKWMPVDSYINEQQFYLGALKRLETSGWMNGYSISQEKGQVSCEFNFGEIGFVQMGAVVEDQGTWDDFADYMASGKHIPMNGIQCLSYTLILRRMANRNIEKIRSRRYNI